MVTNHSKALKRGAAIATAALALGAAAVQTKSNNLQKESQPVVRYDNDAENYGRAMLNMSNPVKAYDSNYLTIGEMETVELPAQSYLHAVVEQTGENQYAGVVGLTNSSGDTIPFSAQKEDGKWNLSFIDEMGREVDLKATISQNGKNSTINYSDYYGNDIYLHNADSQIKEDAAGVGKMVEVAMEAYFSFEPETMSELGIDRASEKAIHSQHLGDEEDVVDNINKIGAI